MVIVSTSFRLTKADAGRIIAVLAAKLTGEPHLANEKTWT
jgi:hypothetical protein